MSADESPDRPPPPPPDPPKREQEAAAVTDQGGGSPADIVERHPADHSTSVGSSDAADASSQQSPSESADQALERWKQADARMYADQLDRATPEQFTQMREAAYQEFNHTGDQMQATALKDDPESDQAWREAYDRNQIAQQRLDMLGKHESTGTPFQSGDVPTRADDDVEPVRPSDQVPLAEGLESDRPLPYTVTDSGGLNFLSSSDIAGQNASRNEGIDGYTDVIAHANPYNFALTDGTPVQPTEMADAIRTAPDYEGGPVRLLACKAGQVDDGAAQQVADNLGQPVMAATDTVWPRPDGELTVGPNPWTPTGEWRVFNPRRGNV